MTLTRKQYRALQRNLDDALVTVRSRILHPDRDPVTAAHDIRAIVQAARDPKAPLPEDIVRDFIALGEQGPGPFPPDGYTLVNVTPDSALTFTPPWPFAERSAAAIIQDLIDDATPHQRGLLADTARNTPPATRTHADDAQTPTIGNPPLIWWDDPYTPGARPIRHEGTKSAELRTQGEAIAHALADGINAHTATNLATGSSHYVTDNTMDGKFGGGSVSPRARARRGPVRRAVRRGVEPLRQWAVDAWDSAHRLGAGWMALAGVCLIGYGAFIIWVSTR